MRNFLFSLMIFLNISLLANPIVITVPVISEFYYNGGNWQIELCIRNDLYGWTNIQSFNDLGIISNAGQASITPFEAFYFDSVYIIDQSVLASSLYIDPLEDHLNIICYNYIYWDGISYSPYPDTMVVSSPGEGESIAVQYFGYGMHAYTMKQSPPSIGTDVFEVSSRSGISGFVLDDYLNPVPGISLDYYPNLRGKFPLPLISLQTDSNGYYESEEMFPMGYYVELTLNNYVLETDMMYFEPDSSYHKEYILINPGIPVYDVHDDIKLHAAPNPFSNKTTFNVILPEELIWNDAKIIVRNTNGHVVDFIPLTMNPWAGQDISVSWSPGNLPNGLYIYSMVVDGQVVRSGKLISY